MLKVLNKMLPYYRYSDPFACDRAPAEIIRKRRLGREGLRRDAIQPAGQPAIPDIEFGDMHRVPFQFREAVQDLPGMDPYLRVSDQQKGEEIFSSYGVDVFGGDFYKSCLEDALAGMDGYDFKLGKYHPVIDEVIRQLKEVSGQEAFTFHMSGTEAVLSACRMARLSTGRDHIVKFRGAYHGWTETAGLKTINSLFRLRRMNNAAGVLINPLTHLYKRGVSKTDALLYGRATGDTFDKEAAIRFIREVKDICTEKQIPLIFDEVFLGFRLAHGGCQEFFRTAADMVIYGKTLGGGMPVGVVCGRRRFMKKFDPDYPLNMLTGKGTFSAHPLVLLAMHQFLRRVGPQDYAGMEELWNKRVQQLNRRVSRFPIKFDNLQSVMTTHHLVPSRYNWMFQFYLAREGMEPGPYGSGRFIFCINLAGEEWDRIVDKFVRAAESMEQDGWWWHRDSAPWRVPLSLAGEVFRANMSRLTNREGLRRGQSIEGNRSRAHSSLNL